MCNVGDKIYILGGQLELNADDDAGSVYILDTSELLLTSLGIFFSSSVLFV